MTAPLHWPLPRVLSPEDAEALVGQRVQESWPNLGSGRRQPVIVTDIDTGRPVLAVFPLYAAADFRRAVRQIPMETVGRSRNYGSRSRTFGYRPRRPTHGRESCGITSIAQDRPDIERVLEDFADQFTYMLNLIDPEIIPADRKTLGPVLPEWRFGVDQLFTSGVVNDTAVLPYHRDRFNFPTWSAMPVVRRGTRGGYLHLPEYDLVVPCSDSTVVLFCGQQLVHGVTPITRIQPDGYRISVVYYALQGMKTCLEYATELGYGTVARTQREADMAARLAAGDTRIPRT